jgi:hypothetical protein
MIMKWSTPLRWVPDEYGVKWVEIDIGRMLPPLEGRKMVRLHSFPSQIQFTWAANRCLAVQDNFKFGKSGTNRSLPAIRQLSLLGIRKPQHLKARHSRYTGPATSTRILVSLLFQPQSRPTSRTFCQLDLIYSSSNLGKFQESLHSQTAAQSV